MHLLSARGSKYCLDYPHYRTKLSEMNATNITDYAVLMHSGLEILAHTQSSVEAAAKAERKARKTAAAGNNHPEKRSGRAKRSLSEGAVPAATHQELPKDDTFKNAGKSSKVSTQARATTNTQGSDAEGRVKGSDPADDARSKDKGEGGHAAHQDLAVSATPSPSKRQSFYFIFHLPWPQSK